MKTFIFYFCLLIVGALSYFVIEKAFDLRSEYYRSKYEKEIQASIEKYKVAEAELQQRNVEIEQLNAQIGARESKILAATDTLRQKLDKVKIAKSETQEVQMKFEKMKTESQNMDFYQRCLDIQKLRRQLEYGAGDYEKCEK